MTEQQKINYVNRCVSLRTGRVSTLSDDDLVAIYDEAHTHGGPEKDKDIVRAVTAMQKYVKRQNEQSAKPE